MINDIEIRNFNNPLFQKAFQEYFTESGIFLQDWDALWQEMNQDEGNFAILRILDEKEVIGFILCQPISSKSCFFEEQQGFIREFWVAPAYRGVGHGTGLLRMAENRFHKQDIFRIILTTDTAEDFYLKNGYQKCPDIIARNKLMVFVKYSPQQL
ncbi:MAG: GNAT family N-acetyltransferase [Clostridia bacterium]|nr:GNAT family N-acetyltransferase [Clostridia bacterium]